MSSTLLFSILYYKRYFPISDTLLYAVLCYMQYFTISNTFISAIHCAEKHFHGDLTLQKTFKSAIFMHPSFKCSSLTEMKRGVVNSFFHISLTFVHARFHTSSIYCINRIFGGRITDGWCIHSKDRHRSEEWVHMAQRSNAVRDPKCPLWTTRRTRAHTTGTGDALWSHHEFRRHAEVWTYESWQEQAASSTYAMVRLHLIFCYAT